MPLEHTPLLEDKSIAFASSVEAGALIRSERRGRLVARERILCVRSASRGWAACKHACVYIHIYIYIYTHYVMYMYLAVYLFMVRAVTLSQGPGRQEHPWPNPWPNRCPYQHSIRWPEHPKTVLFNGTLRRIAKSFQNTRLEHPCFASQHPQILLMTA